MKLLCRADHQLDTEIHKYVADVATMVHLREIERLQPGSSQQNVQSLIEHAELVLERLLERHP